MLDEILEHEQYSWDLNRQDHAVYRLKYRTLNKDLSGISRAMTLVARKALFQDVPDYALLSEEQQQCRIRFAGECLMAWCGDYSGTRSDDALDMVEENASSESTGYRKKSGREETVPETIKGWFPGYLIRMQAHKEKGDVQKIAGKFVVRRKAFRAAFSWGASGNQNDYHAVTYERILASAFRQGPLKRYYLAAERAPFNELGGEGTGRISFADGVDGLELGGSRIDMKRSQKDLLLKLLSAYLLSDRRKQYARKNPGMYGLRKVNKAELTNWWINDNLQPGSKSRILQIRYCGKPVFHEELKGGNVVVMKPQQAFMDDFGWHIIEERELISTKNGHPGWIYYRDQGSGEPLGVIR